MNLKKMSVGNMRQIKTYFLEHPEYEAVKWDDGEWVSRTEYFPLIDAELERRTKKYTLPVIKTLYCTKGSVHHGFVKNRVYQVLSAEMTPEYWVKFRIQMADRVKVLYARHPNRLNDSVFWTNGGNPVYRVQFSLKTPG